MNKLALERFEKEIMNNNFKKMWLDDKSGYWFEYEFPCTIFGTISCCIEPDNEKLYFTVDGDEGYTESNYKVNSWKTCLKILKTVFYEFPNE